MSTRRIPKEAGFASIKAMPKGPSGFPLCRQCSTETAGPKRTFCSSDCVHEWKCRTDPGYQRHHVLKRDRGICAECGVDCVAAQEEHQKLRFIRAGTIEDPENPGRWVSATSEQVKTAEVNLLALRRQFGASSHRRTFWDMDHIKTVVEGGGECGLDNLRTLCIPCHKAATKELARRRAEARRAAKRAEKERADPLSRFRDDDDSAEPVRL